ncbi:MAG: potassium channel family protein [Bacteroidales bacterium]|nr:potassium channel family protein [Bacteroidales bacterium]
MTQKLSFKLRRFKRNLRLKSYFFVSILAFSYILIGFGFGELYYRLENSTGWYPGQVFPITSGEEPPPIPHFQVGKSSDLLLYDWLIGHTEMYVTHAPNDTIKQAFYETVLRLKEERLNFTEKAYNRYYFYYFSFVTLTTLGYGDVVPISHLAQFLVICEVLLGMIYLSFFVGFFGSKVYARFEEKEVTKRLKEKSRIKNIL